MIEWPLVFLAGLLGSSHCVGMCGGFAVSVGVSAGNWRSNLGRQVTYSVGRIFTYAFLGALAGFLGVFLSVQSDHLVSVQAGLCVLAGGLLIIQGLSASGWLAFRHQGPAGKVVCQAARLFKTWLLSPRWSDAFLAGIATGFLPCGLVYAHLALATTTHHLLYASTTMIVFGLGTVPLMVATGLGSGLLSFSLRSRALKIAAWCVVITGVLTVHRGFSFWQQPSESSSSCPYCDREQERDE